ncbi:MAG TPA: cell division protein FtsH, partial [Vicinamibacteria bacterium]
GGHALVAAMLPDADPIHKVTIIPRGRALGVTMQLPQEDKYSHTKEYLQATVTVMMGGRIAEEKFLGHMTTGAGNDIERATDLARKMVCEWGMSEKMGPLTFGRREEQVFLGRDIARHQDYSEDTAIQIDQEVKRIVEQNYARARNILTQHRALLERVAEALLEREVLDAEEVRMLIEGIPLKARESVDEVAPEKADAAKEKESKEKERKTALTPPILQNPGSVTQT